MESEGARSDDREGSCCRSVSHTEIEVSEGMSVEGTDSVHSGYPETPTSSWISGGWMSTCQGSLMIGKDGNFSDGMHELKSAFGIPVIPDSLAP